VILRRVPLVHLEAGTLRLDRGTSHYLTHVLRLRVGDAFVAFDAAKHCEGEGVVVGIEGDGVVVKVESVRPGIAPPRRAVTWIQGLAKGDKCDAVVRDATELGASRVIVAATARSVAKLDAARARGRGLRWAKIAEQAARQCRRGDVPVVSFVERWQDALAGCRADARFCLWEGSTRPLGPSLFDALQSGESLAFACGAEGGLEEDEARFASENGWIVASLGPLVLRTETVAAAVLGAVLIGGETFLPTLPAAGR
jgi:16S rRNA (uracil1498-N3)-methyltransferase